MKEIWKNITGYEGWYQVSNLGNVRSIDRYVNGNHITCDLQLIKGKLLKGNIDKLGYVRVMLRKNVSHKTFLVHRLVATEFIENPNNFPYINHKDENPTNNKVENLEWCSAQYNVTYGSCQTKITKSKVRKVVQFDMNMNKIRIWDSIKQAANAINRSQQNISRCCRNKCNSCGGYKWKYEDDN